MTDLTPTLNDLLTSKYSARPTPAPAQSASTETADEFLKEAYRINSHITSLIHYLQSIRHSYLTTTPTLPPSQRQRQRQRQRTQQQRHSSSLTRSPSSSSSPSSPGAGAGDERQPLTDPQRDTVDSSTALVLRDLSTSITNLAAAEGLRQETADTLLRKKYGASDGFLWRWASGGAGRKPDEDGDEGKPAEQRRDEGMARMTKAVREAVLWFLRRGLEGAVEVQRGMVERRIERVREKEKSVLYKSAAAAAAAPANISVSAEKKPPQQSAAGQIETTVTDTATLSESEVAAIEAQLSPQQLQLFAEENDSMLRHYEDTLHKVQNAEKSLLEIASLQQTLVGHLATQEDYIGQLVSDAANTQTNVGEGNRELKRANEARSTAQAVFWGTVGLCTGLVFWDLIF